MASPGSYKGTQINAGTQAEIQAQMASIDANLSKASAPTTTPTSTTSSTTSKTTSTKNDVSSDPFIKTLQDRLMAQSDAISSANTGIESKINEAITGLKASGQATTDRITSAADRGIADLYKQGGSAVTNANEARRGFATQTGVLKQIYDDTEKSVKDLEQRKQELILQGESELAGQIASMQFKALEFQQQSAQQVYTNLLSAANFGINMRQEARAEQSQDFEERKAMNDIALQYGIAINENDTIDTISQRAAPFASERQLLEIKKLNADINRVKAETAKIIAGDGGKDVFDPATALSLARSYRSGQQDFIKGLTPKQTALVMENVFAEEKREAQDLADMTSDYDNAEDFLAAVENNPYTQYDRDTANRVAAGAYSDEDSGGLVDWFKNLRSEDKEKSSVGDDLSTLLKAVDQKMK